MNYDSDTSDKSISLPLRPSISPPPRAKMDFNGMNFGPPRDLDFGTRTPSATEVKTHHRSGAVSQVPNLMDFPEDGPVDSPIEMVVEPKKVPQQHAIAYDAGDTEYWLNDPAKVQQMQALRTNALANARLLYGSDRNRFHDIVNVQIDSPAGIKYGAVLVITVEGTTKPLRKEIADCPLIACRALVASLHKDTGLLFMKFDIGDKIKGQQGGTGADGVFRLNGDAMDRSDRSRQDETADMTGPPRGPRGDMYRGMGARDGRGGYGNGNGSNKRTRLELDYS